MIKSYIQIALILLYILVSIKCTAKDINNIEKSYEENKIRMGLPNKLAAYLWIIVLMPLFLIVGEIKETMKYRTRLYSTIFIVNVVSFIIVAIY